MPLENTMQYLQNMDLRMHWNWGISRIFLGESCVSVLAIFVESQFALGCLRSNQESCNLQENLVWPFVY